MKQALESLVQHYSINTEEEYENALKEIIQHIALLGLWRAKFFEHAAFYGGTALRIFYDFGRFSEDLDFSLLETNVDFSLSPYLETVKLELESFGFDIDVERKSKPIESQIESAFIKGNTLNNLLLIDPPANIAKNMHSRKKLKVKFEVDIDPPANAEYEVKRLLIPLPFEVRLFTRETLFAGKLHAILCRQWKNRIKGRDYYDMLWYLGRKIPCHLQHLQARMVQTGHLQANEILDKENLLYKLREKFQQVDFQQAKKDVLPFIKDQQELDLWSTEFFTEVLDELEVC